MPKLRLRHLCLPMLIAAAAHAGQHHVRFDGRGFTMEPEGASWQWGLELDGVKGSARVRTEGTRTTYEWNSTIEEWFVNDEQGLEHGFTLYSPLSPAALSLRVRGGLQPRIHADQLGADFLDSSGQSVIQYAGLKVWDADGKILPARLQAEGKGLRLELDATGAHYPITIDPIAQQAYLKASNTGGMRNSASRWQSPATRRWSARRMRPAAQRASTAHRRMAVHPVPPTCLYGTRACGRNRRT